MNISPLLFATPKEYEFQKFRALTYQNEGFPNCDPLMPDILRFFNSKEGVATYMSCQGHPEIMNRVKPFRLFFIITPAGFEFLSEFFGKLFARIQPASVDRFNKEFEIRSKYQALAGGTTTRQISEDEMFEYRNLPFAWSRPGDMVLSFNPNTARNDNDGCWHPMMRLTFTASSRAIDSVIRENDYRILHSTIHELIHEST